MSDISTETRFKDSNRLNNWAGFGIWSSESGNYKALKSQLKSHAGAIEFTNIWDTSTQVIGFGEVHTNYSMKRALASAMPQLQKLGATHLAMEMLQRQDQQLIDDYYAGKVSRETIKNLFADEKKWGWEGQAEGYMSVVDAAKSQGIKVIALDLSDDEKKDLPKKFSGFPDDTEARENAWTENIAKTIKHNPGSRVIVYSGAGHESWDQEFNSGVNNRLENKYGIKSTLIFFQGGEPAVGRLEECFIKSGRGLNMDEVCKVAQSTKLADQDFAIKLKTSRPTYMIHLKETGPFWDLAKQYPFKLLIPKFIVPKIIE